MIDKLAEERRDLLSLEHTDTAVLPGEHVAGHTVRDKNDEVVGEVDDLMVDPATGRVRFLLIGEGGIAGLGRKHWLVPVDIVTEVVSDSPEPTLVIGVDESMLRGSLEGESLDQGDLLSIYRYFDCEPYWSTDYVERDWSTPPEASTNV